MGISTAGGSSQKLLNGVLLETGNSLLLAINHSSSIDDLLTLLQKAESVLAKVWQQPPISTSKSLLPLMEALSTDKLLRHDDLRLQILLSSCMNELTRITVPDSPYPDNVMKLVFQLLLVPINHFSVNTYRDQTLRILEYMAKLKSCLLMMDIGLETTILEMFRLFLNTIRCNSQSAMFSYMQMIMTMIIQESDEISSEILKLLLGSVRMENKNVSLCSWKLGTSIFEKCARKLRPYVREAVNKMNLDVRDYGDVVISLCQDSPDGKKLMLNSSLSTSAKTKKRKKLITPNEKKRKKALVDDQDKLVNSRIQVWWPMDETFYAGIVTAFDPATKKHTVRYDDNEIENLVLEKEIWKPFSDKSESQPDSECGTSYIQSMDH